MNTNEQGAAGVSIYGPMMHALMFKRFEPQREGFAEWKIEFDKPATKRVAIGLLHDLGLRSFLRDPYHPDFKEATCFLMEIADGYADLSRLDESIGRDRRTEFEEIARKAMFVLCNSVFLPVAEDAGIFSQIFLESITHNHSFLSKILWFFRRGEDGLMNIPVTTNGKSEAERYYIVRQFLIKLARRGWLSDGRPIEFLKEFQPAFIDILHAWGRLDFLNGASLTQLAVQKLEDIVFTTQNIKGVYRVPQSFDEALSCNVPAAQILVLHAAAVKARGETTYTGQLVPV